MGAQVETGGVVGPVLAQDQDQVAVGEFTQIAAASGIVEPVNVFVEPDLFARKRGHALRLEGDALDRILGRNHVAACRPSLDGQVGEIVFVHQFLELGAGTILDAQYFRLAVAVGGEPHHSRARFAVRQIVFLVTCDARDGEALGIIHAAGLPVAVDDVVDRAFVAAVEHRGVDDILADKGLVLDARDQVFAVLHEDHDLGNVRAVADVLGPVDLLLVGAYETVGFVGVELGVEGDDLLGLDVLEGRDFGLAGEARAVFALELLEVADREFGQMLEVVAHLVDIGFDAADLLFGGLDVEARDLAYRLLDQTGDVFLRDGAPEQVLVLVHFPLDILQLLFPGSRVVFEDAVDFLFEEDLFEARPVPVAFQLVEEDPEFLVEEVFGMECVVAQDFVHAHEMGFAVHDDAGVGGEGHLAVGESVERVDGLVGRNVVLQRDVDLHAAARHVVDLLDLDLALVVGLDDRVDEAFRGLAVRDFRDGQGPFVGLDDAGADLHFSAPQAFVVTGAVDQTAGGEVRIEFEIFLAEGGHARVEQFVEVVRQDLDGQADGDAVGALGQQQREFHRKDHGLLVGAVVGGDPFRNLLVESDFEGEFAQPGFDVAGGGGCVAGEDVAPVALGIHEVLLLAQAHQGVLDRGVAVRVVLHGITYNAGYFVVVAVLHFLHGVEDAALDGFEAVFDVRDGAVQDYVGGVIEEPFPVHAREFVFVLALGYEAVVFALRRVGSILVNGLVDLFFLFGKFFASFVQFVQLVVFFHRLLFL